MGGFRARTAFLNSCHGISIRFSPDLTTLTPSFFLKSFRSRLAGVFWIDVLLQNPITLQLEIMKLMAEHSPSGSSGREQNLWFHQCWAESKDMGLNTTLTRMHWYQQRGAWHLISHHWFRAPGKDWGKLSHSDKQSSEEKETRKDQRRSKSTHEFSPKMPMVGETFISFLGVLKCFLIWSSLC